MSAYVGLGVSSRFGQHAAAALVIEVAAEDLERARRIEQHHLDELEREAHLAAGHAPATTEQLEQDARWIEPRNAKTASWKRGARWLILSLFVALIALPVLLRPRHRAAQASLPMSVEPVISGMSVEPVIPGLRASLEPFGHVVALSGSGIDLDLAPSVAVHVEHVGGAGSSLVLRIVGSPFVLYVPRPPVALESWLDATLKREPTLAPTYPLHGRLLNAPAVGSPALADHLRAVMVCRDPASSARRACTDEELRYVSVVVAEAR